MKKKTSKRAAPALSQEIQQDDAPEGELLTVLTVDVVCAYVSNNQIESTELPGFIGRIMDALRAAPGASASSGQSGSGRATRSAAADLPARAPAVPVGKSVFPDYIVCLEDGRKLKMLKRHLRAAYNMSPEEYRQRWDLPQDYPMTAPNYAQKRSRLAREIGLGGKAKGRKSMKNAA